MDGLRRIPQYANRCLPAAGRLDVRLMSRRDRTIRPSPPRRRSLNGWRWPGRMRRKPMSGSGTSSPEEKAALYKVGDWLVDNRGVGVARHDRLHRVHGVRGHQAADVHQLRRVAPVQSSVRRRSQQILVAVRRCEQHHDHVRGEGRQHLQQGHAHQDLQGHPRGGRPAGRQSRPDRFDRPPHDALPDDAGRLDLLAAGHAPAAGHATRTSSRSRTSSTTPRTSTASSSRSTTRRR